MVRVRVGKWPRRRRLVRESWGFRRFQPAGGQPRPRRMPVRGAPVWEGSAAEADAPEDVDLVFRLQRRLSFTLGSVFLLLTLAVPVLSIAWPAWYSVDRWNGITPNFVAVAFLLPASYAILAFLYRRKADMYEEWLLGRQGPGEAP